AQGIALPAPRVVGALPAGKVVVEHASADLAEVLHDMMRFSTNITAEAVGMAASARLGAASHAASAREMTAWLRRKAGTSSARLADHSGLGGGSRISPADMVSTLV